MADGFTTPFAENGDRDTIPVESSGDGTLNWERGWGAVYSVPMHEGGKYIRRQGLNQALYLISHEIIKRFNAIKNKFSTGILTATNATFSNTTTSGGTSTDTINVTSSGTIPTPAASASGTEIVNAEWFKGRNAEKAEVSSGYKVWTAIIDMGAGGLVSFADDAASLVGATAAQKLARMNAAIGCYPCILVNGVEKTKLNPNNYTQDINGNGVDITSLGQDVMVKFPKRGLRIRTIGSLIYIQFTDDPTAKDFNYYAFQTARTSNQGMPITKDAFYCGVYEGCWSGGKIYSSSGKSPNFSQVNQTGATFRSGATSRGDGYALRGWFQHTYILAAAVFVGGTLARGWGFGYGLCSIQWFNELNSVANSGFANTYGMVNQNSPNPSATNGTASFIHCLGLENYWGNSAEFLDGVFLRDNRQLYVAAGTHLFNDSGSGYTYAGDYYPYRSHNAITLSGLTGSENVQIHGIAGNDLGGFYPTAVKAGAPSKIHFGAHISDTNAYYSTAFSWSLLAVCGGAHSCTQVSNNVAAGCGPAAIGTATSLLPYCARLMYL